MTSNRFAKFAWFVLAYNILVVLWGAYVRATGSGAGCGAHWPICNGQVIPRNPALETMVEFSHRMSSGLALLLVLGLLIWAFRAYPKGHRVRQAATLSSIFIITEALVGAGLVLFRWVADDDSIARVYSMAVHLINTFILLAVLALAGYWSSGGNRLRWRGQGAVGWSLAVGLVLMLLVGVSGAVIALGDTLVLEAGLTPEESPVVAMILSIRIYHPAIAVISSLILVLLSRYVAAARPSGGTQKAALSILIVAIVQLLVGVINVALKAPVAIQIIHLLLAVFLWLGVIMLTFYALDERAERASSVKWSQVLTAG